MKQPHIILLNEQSLDLAKRIADLTDGKIEILSGRTNQDLTRFEHTGDRIRQLFKDGNPIIAIMASGAVIRLLAPVLEDKHHEPPVLSLSVDGTQIIPLLGGHHGANELARKIAQELNGNAAITTAGDIRFGVALDEPPQGYVLSNPDHAKSVMAALVAGATVRLEGSAPWLEQSGIEFADDQAKAELCLKITDQTSEGSEAELVYHPQTLVLGIGCERGAEGTEAIELVEKVIGESGFAKQSIAAVCSIDLKADERAIHEVAAYLGVPARFYQADELEAQTGRLKNPSEIVFNEVGCHGVAEGASLAAVGEIGTLMVEKTKSARVTCAIAQSVVPIDVETSGRSRGKLFVVGIGPGSEAWRSPEVARMIGASTDLVGYSLYLDLIEDISSGKTRHDFSLGKEEDRVRHAMELAGEGKDVALVCSGDAGIYAMATLVFELLDDTSLSDGASRIEVEVSPGISALQAAAARAGAPLGHDFCTISLSDLLTPWPDIQKRIKGAAEGDFVIAFYNPVSLRRRTQLAYARDQLLKFRPADTPVILATNLGREGERIRVVDLADLQVDDVDMLTVVIVGSSDSRTVTTGEGKTWVYTPRGYSSKQESNMIGKVAS